MVLSFDIARSDEHSRNKEANEVSLQMLLSLGIIPEPSKSTEISVHAEKKCQCTLLRNFDGNRFQQAVSVCGALGCT